MRKNFKKSSQEEVEQMVKLYKQGVSYSEIGRRFNKDHTTIMWWIKRHLKEGDIETISEMVKRREAEKPLKPKADNGGPREIHYKKSLPKNVCQWCGKKDFDPKWKMTKFCCLICWDNYHQKVKNILL